jgi:hypothetical protein
LSEALRAIVIASAGLAGACAWLAFRALRAQAGPVRIVVELRLAQLAAAMLILAAGASWGFAASHENVPGVGLEVALALGFFVVAGTAALREPKEALTLLALAFAAHALFDILHRPGVLPDEIAPRWYIVGCAIYDLVIGAICYLPVLRR